MDTRSHLRLLLFDVDGTLITTNGVARGAFIDALETVFERTGFPRDHEFAGKTDQQIYYEIMAESGIDRDLVELRKEKLYGEFIRRLTDLLTPDTVEALPGVAALLEALAAEQAATVALLTGNLLRGAQLKLTPPRLLHYFGFGAFGDDAVYRHQLPAIALERAYKRTGYSFRAKEIVVIGDTPNDIDCGRHLNVRSIAVATGRHAADDLMAQRPDFLFRDLTDTEAVLSAIFA
jgi:phosphoglycolate phosphatase-like HAD superfamily hydrolase